MITVNAITLYKQNERIYNGLSSEEDVLPASTPYQLLLPWLLVFAQLSPAQCVVYVAPFQAGEVSVFQTAQKAVSGKIPVEDGAGVVGLLLSSDGRRLYLVDGNTNHRIRIIDATTLRVLGTQGFPYRLLSLSARPVAHLTADGRLLLVSTFDPAAAAHGVRVFDTAKGEFAPLGLQGRGCEEPRFVSSRSGAVATICPDAIRFLRDSPPVQASREVGVRQVADAALSANGNDLYWVAPAGPVGQWQLTHQATGERSPRVLSIPGPTSQGEKAESLSLELSADGNTLAVAGAGRIWLIDPKSLQILREIDIPGRAAGARFCPGTSDLLVLSRNGPEASLTLYQVDAKTGDRRQAVVPINTRAGPLVWAVGISPK